MRSSPRRRGHGRRPVMTLRASRSVARALGVSLARRGRRVNHLCRGIITRRRLAWVGLVLTLFLIAQSLRARPTSPVRVASLALPPHRAVTGHQLRTGRATGRRPRRQTVSQPLKTRRSPPGPDATMVVTAQPSLSPTVIDATLAREGSPLAGQGHYIWTEGRRWGIDPVFLLAFVSFFDLRDPLTVALHNVGHIHAVAGQAASPAGYRIFATWQEGITAWYRLVRDLYIQRWGLRTLDQIVPVYAPGAHGAVEAEVNELRGMVTAWRGTTG